MLTQEDDVEIHALARRGWSVSAIARHTGRDRKTVAKYLAGKALARVPAPSCLEPFRPYLEARFEDDVHVLATTLFEELVGLGFDRSYPTLVREIRELGLRPVCECCWAGGVRLTVGLEHAPGEELQLDWLELRETPWAVKAYVLVGALSHSSRLRGVFSEGQSFPHLAEALDGVLRRLGGTATSAGSLRPGRSRARGSALRPVRESVDPQRPAGSRPAFRPVPRSRPVAVRVREQRTTDQAPSRRRGSFACMC